MVDVPFFVFCFGRTSEDVIVVGANSPQADDRERESLSVVGDQCCG